MKILRASRPATAGRQRRHRMETWDNQGRGKSEWRGPEPWRDEPTDGNPWAFEIYGTGNGASR
jgi:hypothetical protein